eukprot:gene5605-biopygen13289
MGKWRRRRRRPRENWKIAAPQAPSQGKWGNCGAAGAAPKSRTRAYPPEADIATAPAVAGNSIRRSCRSVCVAVQAHGAQAARRTGSQHIATLHHPQPPLHPPSRAAVPAAPRHTRPTARPHARSQHSARRRSAGAGALQTCHPRAQTGPATVDTAEIYAFVGLPGPFWEGAWPGPKTRGQYAPLRADIQPWTWPYACHLQAAKCLAFAARKCVVVADCKCIVVADRKCMARAARKCTVGADRKRWHAFTVRKRPQIAYICNPQMAHICGPQMIAHIYSPQMVHICNAQMPCICGPQMACIGSPRIARICNPQMACICGPQMARICSLQMAHICNAQMTCLCGLRMAPFAVRN